MRIVERMFSLLLKSGKKEADLARFLGVSTSQTTNWKTRNTDPPAKLITDICKFLNVNPVYLLTGENSEDDLSTDERQLLSLYRHIHPYDQSDLLGNAKMKAERMEREAISKSPNSDSGKTA